MAHQHRQRWGDHLRSLLPERTLTIVLLYVLGAGVWIAATDRVIAHVAPTAYAWLWLSTLKGEFFVGGTALLLFLHLRRERRVRATHETRLRQQGTVLDAVAQHLQEGEERYRTLFESGPFPKVLYDPATFAIVAVNDAAAELYGYGRDELLAMTIKELRPPEEIEKLAAVLAQPLPDRYHAGVWTHRRKDGTHLAVDVYTHAVVLGGRSLHLAEFQDVTDRQRVEAALARHAAQLEAVRAVSLEVARELALPAVFDLVFQRVGELIGTGACTLWLWNERAQVLVPQVWHSGEAWRGQVRLRLGEGVAGVVAQRREGLLVNDYRTSAYALPAYLAEARITAVLCEPLLYGDRVLGAISLDNVDSGRPFTDQDREVLSLLATHAAIAIENARLFAAAEERARDVETLRRIDHAITTRRELPLVLEAVVAGVREMLGTPHAQIVLWDAAAQHLRYGAAVGPEADRVREQTFAVGQGVNGVVAQTRHALLLNDYQTSPYALAEFPDVVATLTVPILFEDRLLGVLHTHSTHHGTRFASDDLQRLLTLANQSAIAIENARLYEAVRTHATELEARVRERTEALETANQQLRQASRFKSEFLANMSHEIRTPLNSILGFAQLLLDQTKDLYSAKQARFLTHISTSGQHLLQLINDILDLAKVEAGKTRLELAPLDVAQVLEDILVIARGLAHKKSQHIEARIAPALPPLHADPLRLKQVCFNLLSNAVKFTPDGGRIVLAAQPTPDGAVLDLRVTDTGIGIRAEDLPRLFQEFVQLDREHAQREDGTGLGLALSKRLVELHGGTIAAASPGEGQGSTFTVRLPFAGPAAPEEGR